MSYNYAVFIFLLGFLITLTSSHEGETTGEKVDPFVEILKKENIWEDVERRLKNGEISEYMLPSEILENVVVKLFSHFKCGHYDSVDEHHDHHQIENSNCNKTLCLNVTRLIQLVGGNNSLGLTEEQFDQVSLVLLHYVTQINTVCNTEVDPTTLTLTNITDRMLSLAGVGVSSHPHLHEADVSNLLRTFKDYLSHDGTGHDDHGHEHDHDHEHVDHEGHGHGEHTHDDHSHDEHEHGEKSVVVKEKCLSGDALFYHMGLDHAVDLDRLGRLSSFIIYFIYSGYDVEDKCRLLPQREEFLKHLFSTFAVNGANISLEGLEGLMTRLGINPEADTEHVHAHGETEMHSHEKRSIPDIEAVRSVVKRQTADQNNVKRCYTASQIMAIHDAQDGIDQAMFQQICPSLVSQKLFADCSHVEAQGSSHQATQAEKYGYATVATAIICLCSIFGVIFIPFVSRKVYDILMSMFVGLAVGTLFADAVLHLIPMTLGAHTHGDSEDGHDHEHGNEIVVETYVLYGLAMMAGLYFFYILETVMSRFGGHSHGDGHEDMGTMMFSNNHTKTETFEEEGDLPKDKSGKSYVVHADSPGMLPDQKPSNKTCGLAPVALMIVLGDGIHNFADGLAIGASFTSGISTGIATSIAVFCHELPHELGDFAVLLQSGLSFKKAVFLNLASALTAFAGLYVSLSVTTGEEAQKWIFAVTSGMFLYIALVDLLPQLIKVSGHLHFTLNNIGILVGFAIMLVIAVFEEHIKV